MFLGKLQLIYFAVSFYTYFASLLLTVCMALLSHAQSADTTTYYIKATTTGSISKTNDGSSYLSNNNLRFSIIKKTMVMNTNGSWIYGAQTTGLTNNDFFAAMDYSIFKTEKGIYYWGLAAYDRSYSLKITDRIQTGAGIGYTFLKTTSVNVSLSDGFLYENGDLYETDLPSGDYETLRNSFRLKYRFAYKEVVVLDGIHFWQQSFFSWEDYIIKSNSTLSVKLQSWLSLTLAVGYNKLNLTQRENVLINYGLTFEKTF